MPSPQLVSSIHNVPTDEDPKVPSPPSLEPHVFSVNSELFQYLEDYVAADNECPEFAIGIYGDWGIGKTFFIKEWLKYRHRSHCYLSLFGISSLQEIEDAIFKTEHPMLSSPAVKASLEVASVFSQNKIVQKFPTLCASLTDEFKKLSNNLRQQSETEGGSSCSRPLLVLDDVERTSLLYPIFFGYIATLLQCRGYKIVLLYNRDKLAKICNEQLKTLNEDQTFFQSFTDLLQKAVGIEFAFHGDFEDALKTIFVHHPSWLNTTLFTEILKQNGNNLRQVKQALWRFKCRWPTDIQLSEVQQLSVFSLFLAATCSFPDLPFDQISHFATRFSIDENPSFYDRYTAIPANFDCPLSPDLIAALVCANAPRNELHQQIQSHLLSAAEGTPAWRTLMDYHLLTREQLNKAVDTVFAQLRSTEPLAVGELLHINALADCLQANFYLPATSASAIHALVDHKLQCSFDENAENLSLFTETDPNLLHWDGYGISPTKHIRELQKRYKDLLEKRRTDNLTTALSSPVVDADLIRDLLLQKKTPISQKLCQKNTDNFVRLLSQWDRCYENTKLVKLFLEKMHEQRLDAQEFFTNILQQVNPPNDDYFAQARYQLMKKTLKTTLTVLYHQTDDDELAD